MLKVKLDFTSSVARIGHIEQILRHRRDNWEQGAQTDSQTCRLPQITH